MSQTISKVEKYSPEYLAIMSLEELYESLNILADQKSRSKIDDKIFNQLSFEVQKREDS